MNVLDLPMVIKKRVGQKSLRLRVNPLDSSLYISAPYFVSKAKIIEFIKTQEHWIREQILKANVLSQFSYIFYLGKRYELEFQSASKAYYQIKESQITLGIKGEGQLALTPSQQLQAIQRMMLEQMRLILPPRVKQLAEQVKTPVKLVRFRNMKTQWGNCYPRHQLITLNTELIKYPLDCIDYVIYHELAHFHHFDHGPQFKSLLTLWCPQWRELRQQLKIPK